MEEWRIIDGFLSRYGKPYFVSNLGRFKNGYGRILSFHPHKKGYLMVQIPLPERHGARWQAHRLVAKAFLPNPNNYPQVNHKNTIKTDNRVDNLEWCTNAFNMKHAIENNLYPEALKGEKNKCAHLTNKQASEIRSIKLRKGPHASITRKMIAEMYGVTEHVIKDVRVGKSYIEA